MLPPTKLELNKNPEDLKSFFEEQILPHLKAEQSEDFTPLADIKLGKEFLSEYYQTILNFDPSLKGKNNFSIVLMSFYLVVIAESFPEFANIKKIFMEKVKLFAEYLYRDAFFRNSYDNLAAWQACRYFKDYRELFRALKVMPNGAEEHITRMSKELDELWSREGVVKTLEQERGDEYVEAGAHEDGMLVQMFRKEEELPTREEYDRIYDNVMQFGGTDLIAETYEKHLEELEARKYRYRLNL